MLPHRPSLPGDEEGDDENSGDDFIAVLLIIASFIASLFVIAPAKLIAAYQLEM